MVVFASITTCQPTGVSQQPPKAIPQPPGCPVTGNLTQVISQLPIQRFAEIHEEHGPLFELRLPIKRHVFTGSQAIVAELCDDSRFDKWISPPIQEIGRLAPSGLFATETADPQWLLAHRILAKGFSADAIRNYWPVMKTVCDRLIEKWTQATGPVSVTEDMTRMTLDTIGLSAFGFDFESFDRSDTHPFVRAMSRGLTDAMQRIPLPTPINQIRWMQRWRMHRSRLVMESTVDNVIAKRRESLEIDTGRSREKCNADLLDLMLRGTDPKTGQTLCDRNIRDQILTFLVAGHETTSGMLSFALYELSRNPDIAEQARKDVDRVLDGRSPQYADLSQLSILRRILDETLRLWPTAPVFARVAKEETVLGGRYVLPANVGVQIIVPALHRDPSVWDSPEEFRPDRFLPQNVRDRAPHSYKPFGHGRRICIGKQFALTEGMLAIAAILQNFEFENPDTGRLQIEQMLTTKPKDFRLRLRNRTSPTV